MFLYELPHSTGAAFYKTCSQPFTVIVVIDCTDIIELNASQPR